MLPGRPYIIKTGNRQVPGTLDALKYKVNVNTMEHVAAKTLVLNEIGVCNLELDSPIAFTTYKDLLVAGGSFAGNVAQWKAGLWFPLGYLNGSVYTLTVYQERLIAGGFFQRTGGFRANSIARWVD